MKTRTKVVLSVVGGLAGLLVLACIIGAINGPAKKPEASSSTAATTQAAPRPSATTQTTAKKYSDTAKFPTGRYADEVRVTIDNLHAAKDCKGLQAEFDKADKNDAAQRARTGTGTADLMEYIEGARKAAGCR